MPEFTTAQIIDMIANARTYQRKAFARFQAATTAADRSYWTRRYELAARKINTLQLERDNRAHA